MALKEEALEKDPNLSTICTYILQNVPFVNSIILCGSRATNGIRFSKQSDYDIILVLRAFYVASSLQKIKAVEKKLTRKLRIQVSINPLPLFRIRNAKGNLFLFKVKREGITLWGKNYISILDPGSAKDIRADWYFSYLSSLMKELVQSFDPNLIHKKSRYRARQLLHASAKASFGCGELLLFAHGVYETEWRAILNRLSKQTAGIHVADFVYSTDFLEVLHKLLRFEDASYVKMDEILNIYISSKNQLLRMFQFLTREFYDSTSEDLNEVIIEYLKVGKKVSLLKNLQYSVLTFLLNHEVRLKPIFSGPQVAQRMYASLAWLLNALREHSIERQSLKKAYDTLDGYVTVQYSDDDVELWRNINCSILAYWPYACTVMGI